MWTVTSIGIVPVIRFRIPSGIDGVAACKGFAAVMDFANVSAGTDSDSNGATSFAATGMARSTGGAVVAGGAAGGAVGGADTVRLSKDGTRKNPPSSARTIDRISHPH